MSDHTSLSNMNVLVVDDHEDNRYLLKSLLEGLGHKVLVAMNGREALELLRKEPADLVISDILMPVMDGYQLCREIRGDESLKNIPFIFYTATYVDQKDEDFALKLGADRFFRKPMNPKVFMEQVQTLMDEVAANQKTDRRVPDANEKEILKLYNERLVHKLEKKMLDLEREMKEREKMQEALRVSEEKYRTLVDQASDAIYILNSDATILDVNPAACTILQYTREELIGMDFLTLIPPEDLERQPLLLPKILKGNPVLFERMLFRKDGGIVPLEISAIGLKNGRIQSIARDISERKRAEEALRESEERYALAAKGANDGLWDWNLVSEEIYFSPRWKSMLGYSEDEIQNLPDEWFDRVHPDDIENLRAQLAAHMDGSIPHFEVEHRIKHKDGAFRWVLARGLAVINGQGKPNRMTGSQTDITDRKRAEEQLLYDAFHDRITRLPNRALFADRLGQVFDRARRTGSYSFAVLHLDLDRFQMINESMGHDTGDLALKSTADRIQTCIRPGDTLARFGGDEFILLLDMVSDITDVNRIVETIRMTLDKPVTLQDQEIVTTASIGIVLGNESYDRPEEYLRDAHLAMHKAKARGRANVEVFDSELYARAMDRLQLELALRRAVERGEIQVYYQPVIDLKTGKLISLEALARWNHPERGILAPAEFLHVAEEAGFLVVIDRLVLVSACEQLWKWLDKYPRFDTLSISVNFCSRQFSEADLVPFLKGILAQHNLQPQHLSIEITESTLMENLEQTRSVLSEIQKLGVKLFIDDFGTGYSSLSYLHEFPIDLLKIDRSFIGQISDSGTPVPIVQTIISLAHTMGLQVVAEGVEHECQCSTLRSLQCNCAQGYFFSRPISAEDTGRILQSGKTWM